MENSRLFEEFPQLYTLEKYKYYEGVLKIEDTWLKYQLSTPTYPKLAGTKLHLFSGYKFLKTIIPDTKKYSDDLSNFLRNLNSDIIEHLNTVPLAPTNAHFNEIIVKLLKQITLLEEEESNDYQFELKHKPDRSIDVVISKFPGYEHHNHFLKLAIDTRNPTSHVYVSDTSLPFEIDYFKSDSEKSVGYYLYQFTKALKSLEEFYVDLNTIDTLCYVVDPPVITTKTNTRTIKFNDRVHLKIILDPCNPTAVTIKIMGPTNDTEYLRELYDERINEWDDNLDIYKNMLKLFDLMYFPMKPDKTNENMEDDESMICNVCFSYRTDGYLPLIRCDNRRCDLIFHSLCLKKWFQTLKETKTFLQVTFGACPFCKEKISTSYIDLYN